MASSLHRFSFRRLRRRLTPRQCSRTARPGLLFTGMASHQSVSSISSCSISAEKRDALRSALQDTDIYFPHPREVNPLAHSARSAKIVEEYVANLSRDFRVNVVGTLTTPMLALNVRKVFLILTAMSHGEDSQSPWDVTPARSSLQIVPEPVLMATRRASANP